MLGTEATVAREYTRALIRDYAQDCRVTLVGSKELAAYAEAELAGAPVSDEALLTEIAPCFRDDGARTDTVVLACTHYPLLIARLRQLVAVAGELHRSGAGDCAPRRRSPRPRPFPGAAPGADSTRAIFTSGRAPHAVLAGFGVRAEEPAPTSVR